MATKRAKGQPAPVWTVEKYNKALSENKYIKADGKSGELKLTGAARRWEQSPDIVYVPQYRVVGTPSEIRRVLSEAGVTQEDVEAAIEEGYTLDNHAENPGYLSEIKLLTEANTSKRGPRKRGQIDLTQLDNIVSDLKSIKIETRTRSKSSTKKGTKKKEKGPKTSPGRRGPRATLAQRINNASEKGRVIDVSTWKAGPGYEGVKPTDIPTAKSQKIFVPGLAVISNNLENYQRAVDEIGLPEYQRFVDEFKKILAARGQAPVAIPRVSPTQVRPASPLAQRRSPSPTQQPVALPTTRPSPPVQSRTTVTVPTVRQQSPPRLPATTVAPRAASPTRAPTLRPVGAPAIKVPPQAPVVKLGSLPTVRATSPKSSSVRR